MARGDGTAFNGQKFRPILKDRWSDDVMASAQLALRKSVSSSIGREQARQRVTTASAGTRVAGAPVLGGGAYTSVSAPVGGKSGAVGIT